MVEHTNTHPEIPIIYQCVIVWDPVKWECLKIDTKLDVTSSKNMPSFDEIKEWTKSFFFSAIVVIKRWWGCIISTIDGLEIVPYTSCNCI